MGYGEHEQKGSRRTNYEKFKKELISILEKSEIGVVNGKPALCKTADCHDCEFYKGDTCYYKVEDWLNAEYIEKPKLTKKEWLLCEFFGSGYITRDIYKRLFWHGAKPTKGSHL